jgi:hypothetical protein
MFTCVKASFCCWVNRGPCVAATFVGFGRWTTACALAVVSLSAGETRFRSQIYKDAQREAKREDDKKQVANTVPLAPQNDRVSRLGPLPCLGDGFEFIALVLRQPCPPQALFRPLA